MNAWEFSTLEQKVLALTGHTSEAEYKKDRSRRAEELERMLDLKPSHRLFEIGSGDGTVAKLLATKCSRIDCTDISESFLAEARKTCNECTNIRFYHIGTDYLSFLLPASYDSGYSLGTFIHMNPYEAFHYLCSIHEILKPGGNFYFDACTLGEQTVEIFREHAGIYKLKRDSLSGLLNYNGPEIWRALAVEANLKILHLSPPLITGWMKVLVQR